MNNVIKKWWFWTILLIICIILYVAISFYMENKRLKESTTNIGDGASDFIEGINNAQSHVNEFSYNNATGKAEYKPSKITLEMYNKIQEGMSQEEVLLILGQYEDILNGENTYTLEWGNEYSPMYDGYWIQITFDINKKEVLKKYQYGLK